jgi:hypothetical protein
MIVREEIVPHLRDLHDGPVGVWQVVVVHHDKVAPHPEGATTGTENNWDQKPRMPGLLPFRSNNPQMTQNIGG